MGKYHIIGLCILLFFSSCCGLNTEVDYKYNDVTIKRVDKCGKTTFYYQQKNGGKIWTEYSGINDGFSGYLRFSKDGKVELLSGDGYFQSKDMDSTKFAYKRISYEDIVVSDSVRIIMLSTRYESERNKATGSKVKAIYRIDKNEWW